jgi:hypothetical protein
MSRYIITFAFGCFLFVIGMTITAFNLYNYEYSNDLSDVDIILSEETLVEKLNNEEFIIKPDYAKVVINSNNTYSSGEIEVRVSYYNPYVGIKKEVVSYNDKKILTIELENKIDNFTDLKYAYDIGVEKLKEQKIYNFSKLFRPIIDVYVNNIDSKYVKIRNY